MSKYFFANQDKLSRAKKVVANNGTVKDRKGFPVDDIAEAVAYRQALEENPKLSGQDLIAEVYKRIGGYLEVNGEAEAKPKPARSNKDDDNDDAKGEVIEVAEDGRVSSSKKKKRRVEDDD